MKGILSAVLLVSISTPAPAVLVAKKPEQQLARVTVYWASGGKGSDRYTRRHKCATGLRLRSGHCAVDPKRIPYGSSVILPDGTSLAAVDTGTAVRNRKAARVLGKTSTERNAIVIDRFFETKRQALAWANSHPHFIPIRVVTPAKKGVSPTVQPIQPLRPVVKAPAVIAQNSAGPRGALQLPKIH